MYGILSADWGVTGIIQRLDATALKSYVN